MEYLLAIGIAMFAGLLLSRLTSKLNLPDVTSYLIAGVLVGPLVLGRLQVPGLGFQSFDFVEQMGLIGDTALGFIAFSMGSEFRISALRKTGRQATVIAVIQALTATVLVDLVLVGLHLFLGDKLPVSTCLILGAIATATAPAATLMVINQYNLGMETSAMQWPEWIYATFVPFGAFFITIRFIQATIQELRAPTHAEEEEVSGQ